jgi:hypothetical protein
MELTLKRIYDNRHSTVGQLFINGKLFCATLEPPFRRKKIKGKTRIAPGRYKITLTKNSPRARLYSDKYNLYGIPALNDVPNFTDVQIHIGNYAKDTAGCILVGESINMICSNGKSRQSISNSTETFTLLQQAISAVLKHERVYITILDE